MSKKIKLAVIGLGNCASSLVQGISYYKNHPDEVGQMYKKVGTYTIADIEIVAAFDIDKRKVGLDVSEAIFAKPNCTTRFSEVEKTNIIVQKGHVLDGVAGHMKEVILIDDREPVDVVAALKESGADMCICYLPVGSAEAVRFYAQAVIDAGLSFINAIPEFICSDPVWINKFKEKGLICAGDDIKSQIGATIVHRMLTRLIQDRGQTIENTYQLNIGGNTDFLNMKDETRIVSKRISKTNAVTSILDSEDFGVRIGPSDFIPHLSDNKICYINIKGRQFGNVPFELDLKLSVEDSPNSAGVMAAVIRAVKLASDKGLSGNINAISAYAFKSPEAQVRDDVARKMFEDFFTNE